MNKILLFFVTFTFTFAINSAEEWSSLEEYFDSNENEEKDFPSEDDSDESEDERHFEIDDDESDDDSVKSFNEVFEHYTKKKKSLRKARNLFRIIDTDKSGLISATELKVYLGSLDRDNSDDAVSAIIGKTNREGSPDNQIDLSEFRKLDDLYE